MEIASFTGEEHGIVIDSIYEMLWQVQVKQAGLIHTYFTTEGKEEFYYKLSTELTMLLISLYHIEHLPAAITKWYNHEQH